MKIAACNENKFFLEMLKKSIYEYSEFKHIEIVVDCYLHGEKMLASDEIYDMIFSGYDSLADIEFAKEIRKNNGRSAMVLISKGGSIVYNAFKVGAFRVIESPVKQPDLFDVLDEYFSENGNNYPLLIKSGIDTVCLNTSEIVYVEAANKNCYVYLKYESVRCNYTMAKIYAFLPKNHFLKINRAYIVNADYVNKFNNSEVVLSNGSKLRISRNYLQEFKKNYRCFTLPRQP